MMRVKSVCWVFRQETPDSTPCAGHQEGMKNLFLLEFDDKDGRTHTFDCHPFCSWHGHCGIFAVECHQERVWNGLQSLRTEIGRMLGRCSEKQGSFAEASSQVFLGREAWQFLLPTVQTDMRPPTIRNALVKKRVLEPGLLLKANPTSFVSTMIRFETDNELRALSSVLGELVTTDVRKRRPKHTVTHLLFVNHIVNVVAGSDGHEEPFQFRTNKQGVDLLCDGTKVRIRIRCQRCQCNLPLADGSPSTILTREIATQTLV